MDQFDSQSDRKRRMVAQTLGSGLGSEDGSSLPESRELDERLLDEGQLRVHFARLQANSEELEVSVKRTTESVSESAQLEELVLPLVKSTIFGAQIHYSAGGCRWLETLIATINGVRLVRLQLTL